ncbi:MAG: DinB family protein [Chloroflexi bacterium]|nr:DinB family protein [Chloroflexota bacterium]MBI3733841.1 DinB family protein [Chloroflexota bacterium]
MTPEHQELINRIRASADGLQQAVAAVPAGQRALAPKEGEWSVSQILDHTRNAAVLAFGTRIRRALVEDNPSFANFDEEAYQREVHRSPETAADILDMIIAEHRQIARLLNSLPDEYWRRQGHHPQYGPMPIELLALRVAEHAEEHIKQISELRFPSET